MLPGRNLRSVVFFLINNRFFVIGSVPMRLRTPSTHSDSPVVSLRPSRLITTESEGSPDRRGQTSPRHDHTSPRRGQTSPRHDQTSPRRGQTGPGGRGQEVGGLTQANHDMLRDFLDSVAAQSVDKVDLRAGFFTEPRPSRSWHHLNQSDVIDHHRVGVFPHSKHPLSIHDPEHHHRHRKKTVSPSRDHHHHHHRAGRPKSASRTSEHHSVHPVTSSPRVTCTSNIISSNHVPSLPSPLTPTPLSYSPEILVTADVDKPLAQPEGSDGPSCVIELEQDEPLEGSVFAGGKKDSFTCGLHRSTDGEISSCKVAFILGADDIEYCEADKPNRIYRGRSSSHRLHDVASRCRLGDEVLLGCSLPRVATEPDEAELLDDLCLQGMASHRFTDSKGLRRRKITRREMSTRSVSRFANHEALIVNNKDIDASHKMFVELDELRCVMEGDVSEWVWKERARWIKFEEEVMEGADRWGVPHVSSLSFHSLLELRSCLEKGAVLLDLDAGDLLSVAQRIVDELSDDLSTQDQERIIKVLLLKHRHHDQDHSVFLRRNRSHTNLVSFAHRLCISFAYNHVLDLRNFYLDPEGVLVRLNSLSHHKPDSTVSLDQSASSPAVKSSRKGGANLVNQVSLEGGAKPLLAQVSLEDGKSNGTVEFYKKTNGANSAMKSKSVGAIVIPEEVGVTSSTVAVIDKVSPSSPALKPHPHSENLLEALTHVEIITAPSPPPSGFKHNASSHILKRIPPGAEATNVLVGCVDFMQAPVMAFVRLRQACHIGNMLEVPLPVRFVVVLVGPPVPCLDYYEVGRSISTLMSDQLFHDKAYQFENKQDLLKAIHEFLDDSIVLPPGNLDKKTLLPIMEMARQKQQRKNLATKQKLKTADESKGEDDDPLKRTGRLFGGVIRDIRKRYPLYITDIRDGLNVQCLATFFFVYFACLSPAITFGGLLGEKTDGWIGVSEMLFSTALCGIIFSLFSAQPLVIIGATGPVLVFEEAIYKVCKSMELEYLSFRCWLCAWILIIVILVVMLEGSFLVRYITRFTEELFASLISLIFIYEVFSKLYKIFLRHPLKIFYPPPVDLLLCLSNSSHTDDDVTLTPPLSNHSPPLSNTSELNQSGVMWLESPQVYDEICYEGVMKSFEYPNTALFSVLLTFSTFFIALFLKKFRNSQFLGRSARRAIGDFGVPIAIIVMVFVDVLTQPVTEKLLVPDGLTPTNPSARGWLINPFGQTRTLPVWAWFLALVPALLLFILLFMEVQITSMIVNKKDRKLKKGSGYHFDLLLIGTLVMMCGLLGLPVMCSAAVRSLTHVSALSVYSHTHAPGEKPVLEHVKEQRVTSLLVHVMIGVSLAMGSVLRQVPLVVLFGIFLYMGIASMTGIQFLTRVKLLFIPVKHHPNVGYVKRVRRLKMNVYTCIQLLCLAVLWTIKATVAAVAFPFILALLIPLRLHGLKFIFTQQELTELDRDEEHATEDDDDDDEPDFYTQAHMPL